MQLHRGSKRIRRLTAKHWSIELASPGDTLIGHDDRTTDLEMVPANDAMVPTRNFVRGFDLRLAIPGRRHTRRLEVCVAFRCFVGRAAFLVEGRMVYHDSTVPRRSLLPVPAGPPLLFRDDLPRIAAPPRFDVMLLPSPVTGSAVYASSGSSRPPYRPHRTLAAAVLLLALTGGFFG